MRQTEQEQEQLNEQDLEECKLCKEAPCKCAEAKKQAADQTLLSTQLQLDVQDNA